MKIFNFNQSILNTFLILLCGLSTSHAQIYKWVDANGRTHYSEKKEDAVKAKTEELKIRAQPASTQANTSSAEYWQEQDRQFRQRQIEKSNDKTYGPPPVTERPKSLSGGKADETNASKCNLARDVISGGVKHGNGAATDKYDREVAANDIRAFCR
jgi:hypothetical protein